MALLLVVLVAVAVTTAQLSKSGVPGNILLFAIVYFTFFYICVFVHEAGHALAAAMTGHRVHVIAVGQFCYRPRLRKFSHAPRVRRDDIAGWVFATKPEDADWRKGRAWYVFGGAFANFALAATTFEMGLVLHTGSAVASYGLAVCSTAMGIANLVPSWRGDGTGNDGAQLIDLFTDRNRDEVTQKLSRLYGDYLDGADLSASDAEFAMGTEFENGDPRYKVFRELLLANYYLTSGQLEKLKPLLQKFDFEAHPELNVTYAFVLAMVDRDGKAAAKILDNVPPGSQRAAFSYLRAKAVIAALNGQQDEAMEAVRQARSLGGRILMGDAQDRALFEGIERGVVLTHGELQGVA